jgi:membrane protease YdiL (CAAX protease family)
MSDVFSKAEIIKPVPQLSGPVGQLKKQLYANDSRKDFGSSVRVVITAFSIFVISQALALLFVGFALTLMHPHSNVTSILNDSPGAQFAYIFIAEGLAVGLVLKLVRARGLSLKAIGLGRKPRWNDAVKAIMGFLVFYALLIGVTAVVTLLIPSVSTNQSQDVGFNNLNGSASHLFAFMALVILPPLGEEPLMRGYLYSGLRSRWRFYPAMILTSLLFGLAHLSTGSGSTALWIAGIDTFVLSIILVYLREKTGALYACMLVHCLNNLVAFGVHFHGLAF